MKNQYRQGDLLMTRVQSSPRGTMKHSLNILESSITGHSHSLTKGEIYVNEPTWKDNANFYLVVPEGTEVIHPEHKPIPLEEGVYKVVRQREITGYVKD